MKDARHRIVNFPGVYFHELWPRVARARQKAELVKFRGRAGLGRSIGGPKEIVW